MSTCQSGEVGDARKLGVDGELESDGGKEEDEGKLETVLTLDEVHGVRAKRHTADEDLYRQTTVHARQFVATQIQTEQKSKQPRVSTTSASSFLAIGCSD